MAFARLKAVITLDDKKATAGLKSFGGALASIGKTAAGNLLAVFARDAVRSMGRAASSAFSVGLAFTDAMAQVRASMQGVSEGAMADLTAAARELGKTTAFSAVQAASAMESFAKSNFNAADTLLATTAALNLAAAGQLSMGQAASITTGLMNAFGKEAKDISDIADLLAKAANLADQTIADLGQAFVFVGSTAEGLGISMTEASAGITLLSRAGIPAGIGGRRLAAAMRELATGTTEAGEKTKGLGLDFVRTAEGGFSLIAVLEQMVAAGITAEDLFKGMGSQAAAVFTAFISQGVPALKEIEKGLRDRLGFSAKVGQDRLNSLKGDLRLFTSAASNLGIALFLKVEAGFRAAVQAGTAFVTRLGDAVDASTTMRVSALNLGIGLITLSEALINSAVSAQIFFRDLKAGILEMAANQKFFDAMKFAILGWSSAMEEGSESTRVVDGFLGGLLATLADTKAAFIDLRDNPPIAPETAEAIANTKVEFAEIVDLVTAVGTVSLTAQEALQKLVADGANSLKTTIELMEKAMGNGQRAIETLGKTINRNLRGVGVSAAFAFGDALVDAAFGASFSFKKFFKQLLNDLARAIIQALILKAILGFSTGGAGAAVPIAANSGALLGFQGGGFPSPSLNRSRDSVAFIGTPGEAVLPVELTDFLLEAASGGSQSQDIEVTIKSDIPALVENVNRRVRNRSIILEASKVITQRGQV